MTTYDQPRHTPDWTVTPKHCGQLCLDPVCPICGASVPANVCLGEN